MRQAKARGTFEADKILIHASAMDATCMATGIERSGVILIHASARDATEQRDYDYAALEILIHASARDATCRWRARKQGHSYFNPRIREGCDSEII